MKSKTKRKITNFFGGFGYFVCSIQWLLVIVIYSSFFKSTLTSFTPVSTAPVIKTPVAINITTNVPAMVIAIIFTVLIIVLAVFVFIKIPSTVAKTSKKVVHDVAESATSAVLHTQHLPETTKNRHKVVLRITIVIKILLVIAPVIVAYFSQFTISQVLEYSVSMYLSILLAAFTTILFVIQYIFAKILAVKKTELW